MSNHQSYITLESIIQDYLTEAELPNHKYFKAFHLAFRGMDKIGLDAFYKVQSVKLPINPNYTVTLPSDYLNWTKVGVLNDRGEIIPLYYNETLTTYADLLPNRLEDTQDNSLQNWAEWGTGSWWNYWNGAAFVNIYGMPSGSPFVGNFKIDAENGVLLLNERFHYDYIILEYVCSPKPGNDYKVPVQFREAIIAWLWWKDKRASAINRGQVGITRDLKNDFYNERRQAIAAWKPSRNSEKYQASQEMTRMSLKT